MWCQKTPALLKQYAILTLFQLIHLSKHRHVRIVFGYWKGLLNKGTKWNIKSLFNLATNVGKKTSVLKFLLHCYSFYLKLNYINLTNWYLQCFYCWSRITKQLSCYCLDDIVLKFPKRKVKCVIKDN